MSAATINRESDMYQTVEYLQSYLWAYSKLATQRDRENYSAELEMQKISDSAKSQQAYIGDLYLKRENEGKMAIIEKNEKERTLLTISEIGTLQNKSFIVEDEIKQYSVTEIKDGKKKGRIVYSENIDLKRIEQESEYNEAVKRIISKDAIQRSYKYFGGYVGELRTKQLKDSKKNNIEVIETEYNDIYIAMCKKFQREQKYLKEQESNKKQNRNMQDTPSGNGDDR